MKDQHDLLQFAAWAGKLDVVQEFISRGENVDFNIRKEGALLFWAIRGGRQDIAKLHKAFRDSKIIDKLSTLYDHHSLKPLMQIIAIAGKGNHSLSKINQPYLEILCLDEKTFNFIESEKIHGVYLLPSSIVIIKLKNDYNPNKILSIMLHELAHFVMYEFFKNHRICILLQGRRISRRNNCQGS